MAQETTVTKVLDNIFESICDEICTKYCKYPDLWNEKEHGGMELWESDICAQCPLNVLR